MRERRKALVRSVKSVERRFEIHEYKEATSTSEVTEALKKVVAES